MRSLADGLDVGVREKEEPRTSSRSLVRTAGWTVMLVIEIGGLVEQLREKIKGSPLAV